MHRSTSGSVVRYSWPRALIWPIVCCALVVAVRGETAAWAQTDCRLPSAEQIDAGGALEGLMLVLHGLWYEPPTLEQGVAFGDPGPCPGGSRDGLRGVDIMGWALEVSGPAEPEICSPDDPPIMELPLRSTRCVQPSSTVATRNARVAYPELIARAPFPLLLPPATLPDALAPHWTTLRVTDRRVDTGAPRQHGTIIRYLGERQTPWLLLLIDTGEAPAPWLDAFRATARSIRLRGTELTVLDGLPDYEGSGTGLLWTEAGLRVALFGTYTVQELAAIAGGLSLRPPAADGPVPGR
jgi:hypothetical protein